MAALPALFVSHGSPMLAIEDGPARRFLLGYGPALPRPKAVLVASAHWETPAPRVGSAARPETIHDFGGFPRALHEIVYPAPGDPDLAARVVDRLTEAGFRATPDPSRGLDHGVWVPLSLLYPDADVPVVPVSIQPRLGPEHHLRLGEALGPFRDEGVLVVGSGSLTHNLYEFRGQKADEPPAAWVTAFAEWIANAVAEGRVDDLLDYRRRAPFAERNHPTDEHLLPLFVAVGAGSAPQGTRIHASHTHGILAMDAYAF